MISSFSMYSEMMRETMEMGRLSQRGVIRLAHSRIFLAAALVPLLVTTVAAQSLVDTRSGADPRRKSGGAAGVTVETHPEGDIEGERDAERVDDSYQPKGFEVGKFVLLPVAEVEERYNSNLYAQAHNPKSEYITRLSTELQARSRFSEHALNMTARLEQYIHAKYSNDDRLDAQLNVNGRYDFDKTWEATGAVDYVRSHEDRGSPDDRGGKVPTPTDTLSGNAGTKYQAGRYTFSGGGDVSRLTFENVKGDGGTINNNKVRDRVEVSGFTRGAYEIFPGYSAVTELRLNRRLYDSRLDAGGYERSSWGLRAEAGIGVDLSQLIRGDFLVGYMRQSYEDSRLRDISGPSFRATFNWTPSRMTVVIPSLERSVQETTSAGASGMVRTGVSLIVRHELQRNIVLTATGSVNQDVIEGAHQTNWTYDGRLRGVWALAPEYFVGGEAGYRKRTSNVEGRGFDQVVTLVRFGLRH